MQLLRYEGQRILILAPHADDETLGCGGAIQKYVQAGSPVRVIIASFLIGETKRYHKSNGRYNPYQGNQRLEELKNCMQLLGVADYRILYTESAKMNRYHSKLDALPRVELVELLERQIADFKPTAIYIPSITKHQDHEALHRAAVAASRPYYWHGSVLVYETDGELDYHPNLYVPLTEAEMERKIQALQAYQTQIQNHPHPVSGQSLLDKARFRGSQIYEKYAEAYEAIRLRG